MADAWHLEALDVAALTARGLTGRGIKIGVVDTGVAAGHVDLAGRSVLALDVRGPAFDGGDTQGHGTAMIGLIVGRQGAIAPQAEIVSVRAVSAGAQGTLPQLVEGIRVALEQRVDLLSLSVGTADIDASLSQIIERAVEGGVVIVAAGDDGNSNAPLYPAALTPVISVTASNRDGRCLFNQLPAWMDVVVPGLELPTLSPQGSTSSSGTSPATAVCAGICALLLELAAPARRRALAGQLLGFLTSTGQPPMGAAGPNTPRLIVPRDAATAIDAWLAPINPSSMEKP